MLFSKFVWSLIALYIMFYIWQEKVLHNWIDDFQNKDENGKLILYCFRTSQSLYCVCIATYVPDRQKDRKIYFMSALFKVLWAATVTNQSLSCHIVSCNLSISRNTHSFLNNEGLGYAEYEYHPRAVWSLAQWLLKRQKPCLTENHFHLSPL